MYLLLYLINLIQLVEYMYSKSYWPQSFEQFCMWNSSQKSHWDDIQFFIRHSSYLIWYLAGFQKWNLIRRLHYGTHTCTYLISFRYSEVPYLHHPTFLWFIDTITFQQQSSHHSRLNNKATIEQYGTQIPPAHSIFLFCLRKYTTHNTLWHF